VCMCECVCVCVRAWERIRNAGKSEGVQLR
jgi:hypothetical protein